MKHIIEFENFSVTAHKKKILNNINLKIYKNQVNTILGPSGSGKTTLIKSINRLIELNNEFRVTGDILFQDKSVYSYNVVEIRKNIGMVFQTPNPFPLTIYDNVAFGPRLHEKLDKRMLEQIVKTALKDAGLFEEVKDELYKSALQLSGGQQQRLCIARALAVKPEVLMLDEPTTSLDPISRSKIEDIMIKLKQKYTVLLVTHDIQQAARVSDYVTFLYRGNIIEHGETRVIFETPKSDITERFITEREV